MPTTVRELALACDAQIIGGRPDTVIHAAANSDEAKPGEITFIANARHLAKLKDTTACAVIIPKGSATDDAPATTALLLVDDPELAFMTCLLQLYPGKPVSGEISASAEVDPGAQIGVGTTIEAFASIGARTRIGAHCRIAAGCRLGDDVRIGDHCVLHPNVVLYDKVELGDHVIIHAGTVIGSDGFGYKFRNGEHVKFPQVGTVVIGSHVEIGANTCIDRASLGVTRIGNGTKIDNQVHIAHNVQVGAHVLMCGQVGIGGSTVIEDYAVLASQCGVSDHVRIGKQAMVLAQAGVTKDVAPKDQVMGFPAANRREALQEMAALRKLATHQKVLEELVKNWPELKKKLAGASGC
jgi:UDP-3-O-[3-hydroxymyristoyl] glucosamine N-acyltransferase